MKKPSVLCLLQLPPPIHGVTIMNKNILNSKMLQEHFDVNILPLQFSASHKELGQFGLKKIFMMLKVAKHLIYNCAVRKPDIVYFTLVPTGIAFNIFLIFVAIMKLFGVQSVFHLHGKGVSKKATDKLKKWIYHWSFEGAKVIHLSPRLYSDISLFVKKEDCFYLPNGIPNPLAAEKFLTKKSNKKPLHILFLSNMAINKGPIVLLESIVKLKRSGLGIPFKVSFAGNWKADKCSELFYAIIDKYELQDIVTHLGPKYGNDKFKLYEDADIFVFPTCNDAFPLVVLEAMSYGLPVISTFEGAIPDMVQDRVTGFLVPQKKSDMLADSLLTLLKDRELRIQFGAAGQKRFLSLFTKEIFEDNLIKILEKCLP